MPGIYRAKDVNEAIEMAEQFKNAGTYDWFRGQIQAWPPHSSLFRLRMSNDQQRIRAFEEDLEAFFQFVTATPGLAELSNNRDALFAVAQHYGLATNYIDFTTNPGVAGFFSADTTDPPTTRTESCIYCLNTQDLKEDWPTYVEALKYHPIEFINLNVSNLWRLEAQQGVFLFCDMNWEVVYGMDRILFPYNGYPAYPIRDQIYPKEKSQLEVILDQYFDARTAYWGHRSAMQTLEGLKGRGFHIEEAKAVFPTGGFQPEGVNRPALSALASWEAAKLQPWLNPPGERFHATVGAQIHLNADFDNSAPEDLRRRFTFAVKRALIDNPLLRNKSVEFRLAGKTALDDALQEALQWLWNGLRTLPHTDDDIAEGIGACAFLYREGLHHKSRSESHKVACLCFGDSRQVEFGPADGSSSRGWVSKEALRSAVRADIQDILSPDYCDRAGDIGILLQIFVAPQLLFEFDALARLFARQLAPTQVLERKGRVVFFSPARLKVFGLP